MEFTTQLALHSQATRLGGHQPAMADRRRKTGLSPSLSWRSIQVTPSCPWLIACRLQLGVDTDFNLELFPVHSPLLGESLVGFFPPVSYMLKFSGCSYLISGQKGKKWGVRDAARGTRDPSRRNFPELHYRARHTHCSRGRGGCCESR